MKKFFLSLACVLALASTAWGALVHVQSESASGSNVSFITTPAITTTTGNLIVCNSAIYGNIDTLTDSKGNTYSVGVAQIQNASDTAAKLRQDYVEAALGGASHTFTLTLISPNYPTIACHEISGAVASGSLDKTASTVDSVASTSHSSGNTATTAQANEILIGGGSTSIATTFTATGGFTADENIATTASIEGLISAHLIVSSAGPKAFTYTTSASVEGLSIIGTYREAAVAATRKRIMTVSVD